MLKIDKNTWHYKVYSHWVKTVYDNNFYSFKHVSLCLYIERVIFGVLFIGYKTSYQLFLDILWLCVWPIFALCGFLCGFIPNTWDTDGWKPYIPFIKFNGRQYHLSLFVIPMLFLTCVVSCIMIMPSELKASSVILFWSLGLLIPSVITSLFYLATEASLQYFGIDNSIVVEDNDNTKNKKPNLVFEYLKSKKEKVCPIVTFED